MPPCNGYPGPQPSTSNTYLPPGYSSSGGVFISAAPPGYAAEPQRPFPDQRVAYPPANRWALGESETAKA